MSQEPETGMEDTGRENRKKLRPDKVSFKGKILFVGCGGVAQCTLPLIQKFIDVPLNKITVIDMVDTSSRIMDLINKGVRFITEKITKQNIRSLLEKYLSNGDLLVDLAWEIQTTEFLQWCRDHNVMYINASLEVWDPFMDPKTIDPRKFTLYSRHMDMRELIASWGDNNGPTAVIDHGANPGLVSHFTKLALVHIANKIIKEKPDADPVRTEKLKEYLADKKWNHLAMTIGVKVIHISERDTQITTEPKRLNEFLNTWSPEGFFEEGIAPAEMGWGTHERTLPRALQHENGPRNQICLKTKGMNTWVRSWVPTPNDNGDIIGMVVRHGESFTISDKLTVRDSNGKAIYRPTVHYAYRPADCAVASMDELRMKHYKMQPKSRVVSDEIVSGEDVLGCLLMGHDYGSWWIGSLLDIQETRDLLPNQNATTLQVSISLVAAMQWMILNPSSGVNVPDDLPYDFILKQCYPYLGPVISRMVDWSPLGHLKEEQHCEYRDVKIPDKEDKWQFSSFLFALI